MQKKLKFKLRKVIYTLYSKVLSSLSTMLLFETLLWFFLFHALLDDPAGAAEEKIREHYNELSNLKINSLLGLLYGKKVIAMEEKKAIQSKSLESDRMMYFLDDILIPSLQNKMTEKYNGFLQLLQDSGDTDMKSMAERICA